MTDEKQKPIDLLNHSIQQITGSIGALQHANQLQGGSPYTLEQRVHALESLLSAGLTALTVAAMVIGELVVDKESDAA